MGYSEECKHKYKIEITLATGKSIDEVENLIAEFIDENIGLLLGGRGEELQHGVFETVRYVKCPLVDSCGGRPRCMFLGPEDTCKSANGPCAEANKRDRGISHAMLQF